MTQINVKGLTGDMTFTAEGEPNKSAKVAVIENGQYVAKQFKNYLNKNKAILKKVLNQNVRLPFDSLRMKKRSY